jgi:hypothetical protein
MNYAEEMNRVLHGREQPVPRDEACLRWTMANKNRAMPSKERRSLSVRYLRSLKSFSDLG